jgi:hypothetical protein
MHDVNYYTSGKAATDTKKGLLWLKFIKYPFIGSAIAKILLEGAREFQPKVLDITDAAKLIRQSKKCAIGERVCRSIKKVFQESSSDIIAYLKKADGDLLFFN